MSKVRSLGALAVVLGLLLAPASGRAESREQRDDIRITRNAQFDAAHGVRKGKGTPDDPYVISGWNVFSLHISDTSAAVRIVDNTIENLTLNWIGSNVVVTGNDVGDLRVNENVERTGAPTSGRIERNTFDVVGQLRHFDGMFMRNVVGTPNRGVLGRFYDVQAVNFDGFNGAHFAYNTIYGYVDARLHGHHHSSSYADDSHMHTARARDHDGMAHDMIDHSDRWHQVVIEHNEIFTTTNYYGLAYLDTGHDGNDRTATSETNEELNDPHTHHTRVHIMDNTLHGAGIFVDVFNARDERHRKLSMGAMHISGNTIALTQSGSYPFDTYRTGIEVLDARGLRLRIEDNVVAADPPRSDALGSWDRQGAGIALNTIHRASIAIVGNVVSNRLYGVTATQMTDSVTWTVRGLRTQGVERAVWYDESVENEPRR